MSARPSTRTAPTAITGWSGPTVGFSRSLSLPEGVDADQVQADFDKGVLEVRIPKPAERKPHRVQIGASVEGKAREK